MKKRMRSPRFPFISLQEALTHLSKAAELSESKELKRAKLMQMMGFEGESGPATRTFAALRAYDLIQKSADGIELSDVGKALAENPADLESLQKAALSPLVYRGIWRNARHASEEELTDLLLSRHFSEPGAKRAATIYRANAELAKLDELEIEPILPERSSKAFSRKRAADLEEKLLRRMQRRGRQHRDHRGPEDDAIKIPLSTGEARIPVGISEAEFEKLEQTLALWKDRIVKGEAV